MLNFCSLDFYRAYPEKTMGYAREILMPLRKPVSTTQTFDRNCTETTN